MNQKLDLYERAFWTLFIGEVVGLLLMAFGGGQNWIFLVQIGILLQVLTFPLAYFYYRKGEKLS